MSGTQLLKVDALSKTYRPGGMFSRRKIDAVKNVAFEMPEEPSIVALVGESGSGKTTIAKMILGIESPDSGRIFLRDTALFEGRRKGALSAKALRTQIQSIAQLPFEAFSGLLEVDFYLRRTVANLVPDKRDNAEALIEAALENVGMSLDRIKGKYPHQFSGGELQRISIARALIPDPILIIADEPVSMVDASIRMNIINLFDEIKRKKNVSFLYVTHDLSTAYYLSDEILIMKTGEIVERGVPSDIFARPAHEYTKELIASIPTTNERWHELET